MTIILNYFMLPYGVKLVKKREDFHLNAICSITETSLFFTLLLPAGSYSVYSVLAERSQLSYKRFLPPLPGISGCCE